MTQDVKPTRSELLKVKRQIDLAKSGHKLLKRKRDGLILEFFKLYKRAKPLRGELVAICDDAVRKLDVARVLRSDLNLKSIALGIRNSSELVIRQRNVMGVSVLNIEPPEIRKQLLERGFGTFNSIAVAQSSDAYEKVLEKIIEIAEFETSLKNMLMEIDKTKRRVNALEFKTIPELVEQEAFIRLRLEEMERENIFRMKRIKARA
jgi:V/A-type H+-transporting ATPase subunit D